MKIFSIIVTYNGEQYIEKCISSVLNSTIKTEIIIVDNNSSDSTIEIIEANYDSVNLIKSGANLGFGKANNIGIRKAYQENADYIFLLNQDAYIESNTIEQLIKAFQKNPDFGIISPFHFDYEGNNIEYYFSTIINSHDCPGFINDVYFNKIKDLYNIKFVHAACWLISKDCFSTVGGFDPIFPHYSEDNDYVGRANYYNFKVGIAPKAIVFHKGTHSGLTDLNDNFQLQMNLVILHLKNISNGFIGLFITLQKKLFDRFTSAILYRRGKDVKMSFKLWVNSYIKIKLIRKSRRICKQKGAFIK